MLYSGPAFSATALGDGIVEVKFDLAGESVNKLNQVALRDFAAATQAIAKDAIGTRNFSTARKASSSGMRVSVTRRIRSSRIRVSSSFVK